MKYQEKQLKDMKPSIEFDLLLQQKPASENSFYKNNFWSDQADPLMQYTEKDGPPTLQQMKCANHSKTYLGWLTKILYIS